MADIELTRIENKTFGPNETVNLDGCVFINCVFDGCDFVYSGEADTAQIGCTSIREQNILFCGSAQRTLNTLKALGFTVTSPFGDEPKEQSLQ
jgi:hypothetical protein